MYLSKKNNINVWGSYHNSEKTQLPPPPPVPPHHTPPPPPTTTITNNNVHSSPSSQLMRCTSMPSATKMTTNSTSLSHSDTTTTFVPARPMSWHPIPSRRTSRFCQNDPEIKAKLDRISQSERLLTLRTKIMHS